jgi:UPF0755 protein
MRSKIGFFLLLVFIFFVVLFLWYQRQLLPVSEKDQTKDVVIAEGQSLSEIAANLKSEGLIRSPLAFKIMVLRLGLGKKIQAGYFQLSPKSSSYQIASTLTRGSSDVWVTFPEGQRVEEIAQKLQIVLGIPENEFLKFAKEGYMFPDTYLIPKKAKGQEVAQMMFGNFQRRFDNSLRQDAQKRGLTLEEVVIFASLVERETKFEEDRPKVAGILIKRHRSSLPLEVDATVQYALGYQKEEKSWWKKTLTSTDLAVDSPYNTRKNSGLPPTPIANPGLSSIEAVVYFQENPYLYYLSDKEGKIHYAKTLEEHIENIKNFSFH